jgi:hypothetical protein
MIGRIQTSELKFSSKKEDAAKPIEAPDTVTAKSEAAGINAG